MRRARLFVFVAATCASLPALERAASAGDKPPPPAPPSSASSAPSAKSGPETADSLYNQGNDAYDKGDYPLALELYTGAFKLRKSYDVARNLGLTELKLGKLRDAVDHLTYSVDHYPSNRADTKRQVVDWLAEARSQAGKLTLKIEPEGAACTVNGSPVAREELDGDVIVDPGPLKVECGGVAGFGTSRRTLQIDKGEAQSLTITLPRAGAVDDPPPPPPPSGYSALPFSTRRTILWAGVGVTGLALVGGVVSGVLSITTASDADTTLADMRKSTGRDSPCVSPAASKCGDLLSLRQTQDLTGNVALWTLVGAAGAGAFTAAFLWPQSRDHLSPAKPGKTGSSSPFTSVAIAPGVGGMVLSGSW